MNKGPWRKRRYIGLHKFDRDKMAVNLQTTPLEWKWFSNKISLKFFPYYWYYYIFLLNNIPALVQVMVWGRPGDKPLSEPMTDADKRPLPDIKQLGAFRITGDMKTSWKTHPLSLVTIMQGAFMLYLKSIWTASWKAMLGYCNDNDNF